MVRCFRSSICMFSGISVSCLSGGVVANVEGHMARVSCFWLIGEGGIEVTLGSGSVRFLGVMLAAGVGAAGAREKWTLFKARVGGLSGGSLGSGSRGWGVLGRGLSREVTLPGWGRVLSPGGVPCCSFATGKGPVHFSAMTVIR